MANRPWQFQLMYPADYAAGFSFLRELICRGAVPVNLIVPNGVAVLAHGIAGVAFYGVDTSILDFLHNAHMVRRTILAAIIPIKENNVTRARLIAIVLPQPALLEPGNTLGRAGCKFRDHAGFNITALIGTPAYKAGAPFYTAAKTIPTPVWFAADVAHLGERHRDDFAICSRWSSLKPNWSAISSAVLWLTVISR